MKYTKEQRLDICRRIYSGEISKYKAAEIYDISYQTAREYMRLYRNVNHLPPKCGRTTSANHSSISKIALESKDLETYQSMSKEVKLLCETMGVNRSSFYYWKKRLGDPSPRTKNLIDSIQLF